MCKRVEGMLEARQCSRHTNVVHVSVTTLKPVCLSSVLTHKSTNPSYIDSCNNFCAQPWTSFVVYARCFILSLPLVLSFVLLSYSLLAQRRDIFLTFIFSLMSLMRICGFFHFYLLFSFSLCVCVCVCVCVFVGFFSIVFRP
jgi:hypothetical protein